MYSEYTQMVRTLTSGRCHLSRVSIDTLENALQDVTTAAAYLDGLKRILFYGITTPPATDPATAFEVVHSDTLHGIIGIVTEAGELVERLLSMAATPDRDHKTNLIEELGGLFFYMTMLMDANGLSLQQVVGANRAQLEARYTGGFSQQQALNRNLQNEGFGLAGAISNPYPQR